jgi:tetratricopeptide (TPR) repeat protein
MAIRKEQILFGLALAFGGYVASGYFGEPVGGRRFSPQLDEYAAVPLQPAPLVSGAAVDAKRADLCTEPSETKPLPPRPLAFPPRAELSLAALPLEFGPDYQHLWPVQIEGGVAEGVPAGPSEPAATEAAPPPSESPAPTAAPSRAEREKQAELTYDRLWANGQPSPFFGTLEVVDPKAPDLFALERATDFSGIQLRLRVYELSKQKLGPSLTFGGDKQTIDRIRLASTTRNEVQRRVRAVPTDASALEERKALIRWLLDQARQEAWIYDEALRQAEVYRKLPTPDQDGLRMLQRVLRARGDLEAEAKLLAELAKDGPEGAFRFEGLGSVKARLGLPQDADADFLRAVELTPNDARPHAARAEFLRQRGEAARAVAAAARAEQAINSVVDGAERARVLRIVAACRLAVADLAGARAALQGMPAEFPQPYVEGCLHYAAGDLAAAVDAFRQAVGGADGAAATLGLGACAVRTGKWQEAIDAFTRVADQDPLLRSRAWSGLALLAIRGGHYEAALGWLDRALEADPLDAYAHYLRGRAQRKLGQPAAAESLATVLRLHDDFVHAIAEMATLQAARGSEQATFAVAARRYADRAVGRVPVPAIELAELQGLHAFAVADANAAKAAFGRARDLAADDRRRAWAKAALAVVDYSRGLVDDSQAVLQRLVTDLPKDDPIATWSASTVLAIDDHAEKERLQDNFERADVGAIWNSDSDGALGARLQDGRLVLRGKFSRTGKGEVTTQRVQAVRKGRAFLAATVTMQLGSGQPSAEGFAGLGIEVQRGNAGVDCLARVGVREGKPHLRLVDGRESGADNLDQRDLVVDGFDASAPQQVELRVVPRGDSAGKLFTLVVVWNGRVVHRHDLKTLNGNTPNELKVLLFASASGSRVSDVDVAFDDFQLERRKER